MKDTQSNLIEVQSQIGIISSLESGTIKGIMSEDENNSHGCKPTRFSGKIKDFNYSLKKENASGTGYECDNDDGRDEEFQNG